MIRLNFDINTYYIYFSEGDQLARVVTGGPGSSGSGTTVGSGLRTFYHHGIYIGGAFVIEYNNDSKIRRVSLIEFKNGQRLFRVRYKKNPKPLKPKDVVKKAKDAYKSPTHFGKYCEVDNNCEHFATHCKFGERYSQQAAEVATTVGVAVAVAGTVVTVAYRLFRLAVLRRW